MPNTPEGMPEKLFAWRNEFGDVDCDVAPDEYRTCTEYIPASHVSALQGEIERLCGLLYGARCVYCGEVVGKETLNQDLSDTALREHVLVCPKHPAQTLKAENVALQERVERAEALLKWIPVSERLPEREGRYAVIYREGNVIRWYVADYLAHEKRWMNMWTAEVLAWMEFPEIPAAFTQEVNP